MRVKCVSSNVGYVEGPNGCGSKNFSPNQIYDLDDEFGEYILKRYNKFFKRLDTPKTTKKQSYTDQVKVKVGFDNSTFDPDDVKFN